MSKTIYLLRTTIKTTINIDQLSMIMFFKIPIIHFYWSDVIINLFFRKFSIPSAFCSYSSCLHAHALPFKILLYNIKKAK